MDSSRHSANGYHLNRRAFTNQYPINNRITTPRESTVRLLVHATLAGGVIGHGGSVVRNMEARIGVRIRLGGAIPGCVERVVSITGSDVVSRKVKLDEEVCDVSAVQEALLRVFERAIEIDAEKGDGVEFLSCCCRLLADKMECGILIGKGGKRVAKICRDCRANIRVLRSEQTPPCASPEARIIHITGGLLSVKKALLAVSNILQGLSQTENEQVFMSLPAMINVPTMMNVNANAPVITVHRKELPDPHAEFFPDLFVPVSSVKGVPPKEVELVNVSHCVDEGNERCDVTFRMICSTYEASAIIGKGSATVRLLQNESGAFIQFSTPVDRDEYRIVTISAKEGFSSSYSPAQNAVVRIVARLAEIGAKESCKLENFTVRLAITSAQADSFRGEESILSEIRDVEIQLSEGDLKLSLLSTDEVLRVTGKYRAVQTAMLQIIKKLRDGYFPSSLLTGETNHLSCAIPDIDTYERTKNTNFHPVQKSLHYVPSFNQESMTQGMNHLRISNRSNGNLTGQKQGMRKSSVSSDDLESTISSDKKVSLEIKVPDHAFDSVFGENGRNIDHIHQISAADVNVKDPAPGQTQCAVLVSGEPTQVLAASTLLKAYIQAASLLSSSSRKLED